VRHRNRRVAIEVPDALQQFGIAWQLAAVLRGEGRDERVGDNLGVQGGDGAGQHR
jgi:hypothetical protein